MESHLTRPRFRRFITPLPYMTDSQLPASTLRVHFDAEKTAIESSPAGVEVRLALPWLAGPNAETILGTHEGTVRQEEGFHLLQDGEHLAGAILLPSAGPLEEVVASAYKSMFRFCRDFHLYRIWAYLPRINEIEFGLERYRQFNLGRWQAYRAHFGDSLASVLPAASAVGASDRVLALVFLAGKEAPMHLENPLQVPSHAYPSQYGPRPPGFARASVARAPGGSTGWLSGTASIVGHETIGAGNITTQLEVTWKNIMEMKNAMGSQFPSSSHSSLDYKVYLRDSANLARVQAFLKSKGVFKAQAMCLRADICRADLDLEIEAVFKGG